MNTNFEFFDEEPIENIITCLHYKFDKVIFFGEKKLLVERKRETETFLLKYCNVKQVLFVEISRTNPNDVIKTMRTVIVNEQSMGNDCYFDITGGEGLSLFAFGALSKELTVPVHMYDIVKDELLEFDKEHNGSIHENVQSQHIQLDLDKLIEMHGGKINNNLSKGFKHQHSAADLQDIQKMWNLSHQFSREWNHFSNFLSENTCDLTVNLGVMAVRDNLATRSTLNISKLNRILDACSDAGILHNVIHSNGYYRFSYKNEFVKVCLCDSGSILEQYEYLLERNNIGNDDCRIGVHIDWDGVIHQSRGDDVLNEIDILSLYKNTPVFISCKNGHVDQHALYELETVANRFGGKYAKKILIVTKPLGHSHLLRAEEMEIEVRVV